MKWQTVSIAVIATCVAGCVQTIPHPGLGEWTPEVKVLGPVSACLGAGCCQESSGCQWPLALTVAPPTEIYHRALIDDAVRRYKIPPDEVVLDKVTVTLHTEIVGTVRGYLAEGIAGQSQARSRASNPRDKLSPTPEERLRQLEGLHTQGLLTDEEYRKKRQSIIDGL